MKFLIDNPIVASLSVRGVAIALKSVQIIILVRIYGADLFGVYSVALGVFGLAMVFAQLGLQHFVQREAAHRERVSYTHLRRIGRFLALPGLAAALVGEAIVWNFYPREVALAFGVLVIAAPFHAVSWNQTFFLRGSGRVNLSLFLFEIINPIALILAAIVFRGAALGLAFAFLFASVVTLVLTTIYTNLPPSGTTGEIEPHGSIAGSIVEARSFYATSILQAIQSLADGLVVGFFLRPVDAALYAIITRMAGLVLIPVAIVSMYMNNLVAKLHGEPLFEVWRQMRTLALTSVSISVVLWIVMMALLPFVGLIFDTSFPPEANWTYVLITTTRALQGAGVPVTSALFMSGRETYISRIQTVLLPPYLCVLLAIAPSYGMLGVGLSLLCYVLVDVLATVYVLVANMKSQPA